MATYELLGLPVDRLAPEDFADRFVADAGAGEVGYVCVPNVHQCILAYDDGEFAKVVRGSRMNMSDSVVLHKFLGHRYKLPPLRVLRGDQLTLAITQRAAASGVPVAIVGGKNDSVLQNMVAELLQQCPGLEVAYTYSPPFRDLTADEEAQMLSGIRESGARILLVGLGCPKQEKWMALYTNRLPLMMIGVGAAFDFISGEVKTSADWVHGMGLEWLHRLISEPRRLWHRYVSTNPRFIWLYLTRELLHRT